MAKKNILIFVEEDREKDSFGLANAVTKIYRGYEYNLYALCVEWKNTPRLKPFDFIINAKHKNLSVQNSASIAYCIEELQGQYSFDCILFTSSAMGRIIAPRVATRLGVGLTADVTDISHEAEEVALVRPAFDGKLMAAIVNTGANPLMASIRANVFSDSTEIRKGEIIEFSPKHIPKSKMKVISVEAKKVSQDIRDSRVIVSGGGGTMDYFDKIEPFAKMINGQAAASRRIVDQGIATRAIQVGQSGKIVSPELYIAIGIYGSLQHIEGLKNIKHIVCVNTNKDAPICSLANIVVEGDGEIFIEEMMKLL